MPKASEIAVLQVGGKNYSAWTDFWLRRDYAGDVGSTFQFSATEAIDSRGAFQKWRIQPGDPCNITLAGILALTGHVEVRQGAFNKEEHGVLFAGRSNTSRPVDSSAMVSGGQFRGYNFQQISSALLKPTGTSLVVQGSPSGIEQPFENFSVRLGETVFMAIERLARLRNLRLTDDPSGNLVAANTADNAASDAQLVEGVNILQARGTIDVSKSFGVYNVRAQGRGSDESFGSNDVSARIVNPAVDQGRQKLVLLEEPGTATDVKQRALHELAFSAAAEISVTMVVQGWQAKPGELWDINKTYTVRSPMLDLDRALKSKSVTYAQTEGGTITTIELCTPEGLTANADISPASGGSSDSAYTSDVPSGGPTVDPPSWSGQGGIGHQ